MSRYNPQWENQIKGYRKNRLLLVVRSLPFRATTTEIEAAIRARLTKPDSAIFLWPPGATGPSRHISWAMLAFSRRPDTKMALEELQNLEILGRPVRVERASRRAYAPSSMSSGQGEAARTTAATATTTTAATTATSTTTTAAAVIAANPPSQPVPTDDTEARNPSDSLQETRVPSPDFQWWW